MVWIRPSLNPTKSYLQPRSKIFQQLKKQLKHNKYVPQNWWKTVVKIVWICCIKWPQWKKSCKRLNICMYIVYTIHKTYLILYIKSNFKNLSLEGDSTTYINFKHDKSKLHICMYFVLTDTKNWNRCPPFELENSIRSKGVFNMMGLFWIGLTLEAIL